MFCPITDSPFLALALLDLGKTRPNVLYYRPIKAAYSAHLKEGEGLVEELIWPKMSEEDWEGGARSR